MKNRDNDSLPSSRPIEPTEPERWTLIRSVLVFQLKLFLDAFRDFILSPISLMAVAIDLMGMRHGANGNFARVLELGRTTDRWINLFGRSVPESSSEREGLTVDSIVSEIESLVIDQYDRGGLTTSAKEAIDRSLDSLTRDHRN